MRALGPLLAGAVALGGARETFEFVSYEPPPGWVATSADGGRQYVRNAPGEVGIVTLVPSQPAAGPPERIFSDAWRQHASPVIAGAAPTPETRREGDALVLTGAREASAQGAVVRVVIATVVRQGRALTVAAMSTSPARRTEVDAFLATLRVSPGAGPATATTTPAPSAGAPGGPAGALGFDVPPGYTRRQQGEQIVLAPASSDARMPCMYGVAPARPSTGNLEADAEAALSQVVVPGWRKLDGRRYTMRGTSAAGWPYVWHRAAYQGDVNGTRESLNAMALVLPAGGGQVHVVWGMGSIVRCLADDVAFEQLFHGLRPAGWRGDGGRAITQMLVGGWRLTTGSGLQQIAFRADGRYDRDLGTTARVGVSERTSSTASGGRWTLQGGELVLTPDHRPGAPDRYRVRVYDEWFESGWRRAMALLDVGASPPLVATYYRLDER